MRFGKHGKIVWEPSDGTSVVLPKWYIEKYLHVSDKIKEEARRQEANAPAKGERPGMGITT